MLKTRVSLLAGVALFLEGCVGVGPSGREENIFTKCDSMVREAALRGAPEVLNRDFLLAKIPSPVKDSVDWDAFLKGVNEILLPGNDEKIKFLRERVDKCYKEAKNAGDEEYDMYIKKVLYPRIEETCKINLELPFDKTGEGRYVVAGEYSKNADEPHPRYESYSKGKGNYCFLPDPDELRGHIKFNVTIKSSCDFMEAGLALSIFIKEGTHWIRKEQVIQSLDKMPDGSFSGTVSNITVSPVDMRWTTGDIIIAAQFLHESYLLEGSPRYIPVNRRLPLDLGPVSTPHKSSKTRVVLKKDPDGNVLKELKRDEADQMLRNDPSLKKRFYCP